jgi:hypothetical protein
VLGREGKALRRVGEGKKVSVGRLVLGRGLSVGKGWRERVMGGGLGRGWVWSGAWEREYVWERAWERRCVLEKAWEIVRMGKGL